MYISINNLLRFYQRPCRFSVCYNKPTVHLFLVFIQIFPYPHLPKPHNPIFRIIASPISNKRTCEVFFDFEHLRVFSIKLECFHLKFSQPCRKIKLFFRVGKNKGPKFDTLFYHWRNFHQGYYFIDRFRHWEWEHVSDTMEEGIVFQR